MRNLAFLLGVLLFVSICCGDVITVNSDGSADYTTIQAAINAASDGDEVIVADGTYTGDGNRDIDFLGKAITVRSQNGPDTCIIDCQGSESEPHRGFVFQSEESVNSILDGFTITNGRMASSASIACSYSSPTIRNCIIKENTSDFCGGGAMYNYYADPLVENCLFLKNSVSYLGVWHDGGGAICNDFASPIIRNCSFVQNSVCYSFDGGGGAICNHVGAALIENCVFTGNQSGSVGGAIYNGYSSVTGDPFFLDVKPIIRNCLFTGNYAFQAGGAIKNGLIICEYGTGSSSELENCTIVGNYAGSVGGVSGNPLRTFTVINSVFWANEDTDGTDEHAQIGGKVSIDYSCVQGWTGDLGGEGNIDEDPSFITPGSWDNNGTPEDWTDDTWIEGDYHLKWTSPCVNTGDPNYIPSEYSLDIDDEPRVMAGRVDMGADEVGPKQADFTRDGRIDIQDFAVFSRSWDTTPSQANWYVLCDLFEDDIIDINDLAALADDWLWYPDWY